MPFEDVTLVAGTQKNLSNLYSLDIYGFSRRVLENKQKTKILGSFPSPSIKDVLLASLQFIFQFSFFLVLVIQTGDSQSWVDLLIL
jgi:hypothetical protein